MGQGKKTHKISVSVLHGRSDQSEKAQLVRAQEQAITAAAEAERAQEKAVHGAAEEQPVLDLTDPVPASSVAPTAPTVSAKETHSSTAEVSTAAEASMREAATAAFAKATADGLSKDEAREVARKAGKAAFKATMKAWKASGGGSEATPSTMKATTAGALPLTPGHAVESVAAAPATTRHPEAPKPVAPMPPPPPPAAAPGGWVSPLSRMTAPTMEESALQAQAKAREMAERAERQQRSAANAKKGRVGDRSNSARL